MNRYSWTVETPLPVDDAIARVTELLGQQGFGVLTRIDAHAVLEKKLGVKRAPYVILGACNPTLAHRAIEEEPTIGILLPCNVVVEGRDTGSRIHVTRADGMFELVEGDELRPVAAEVTARLHAVVTALGGAA